MNSSITGIIQRSNEKSFILRLHQNSELSKQIFKANPEYYKVPISILQVLIIPEGCLLVEIVAIDKLNNK